MATKKKKRWSRRVMETSDALTLEEGVFKRSSPRAIATSLKRSADRSKRRKSEPYRSAMSMLSFYVNRAGKNMPAGQKRKLEKAKEELRELYGKQPRSKAAKKQRASPKRPGTKKKAKQAKQRTRRTG